jgi:hypothetical protein
MAAVQLAIYVNSDRSLRSRAVTGKSSQHVGFDPLRPPRLSDRIALLRLLGFGDDCSRPI